MRKLYILSILIFIITILFLYQQTVNVNFLIDKNLQLEQIIYETKESIEINQIEINELQEQRQELIDQLKKFNLVSLGTFEITAYTEGFESCGKLPSHPEYGITASGNKVKENWTIAADKNFKFGDKLMIEGLPYIYTVEDRGGAIKGDRLDLYVPELTRALEWGRREREVYLVEDRVDRH